MLFDGFAHLFRPAGLVKQSTAGLVLGNAVNIVLDYVFILPLGWGAAGAAAATSLGFLCSSAYYLFCMLARQRRGTPWSFFPSAAYGRNARTEGSVVSIGVPGALITELMRVANIV